MGFEEKLLAKLIERRNERLMHRFGGIQTCPWCRQIAQTAPGWSFTPYKPDPMLDLMTCGVCEGTSLWRFEIGMIYHGPLDPPKPSA